MRVAKIAAVVLAAWTAGCGHYVPDYVPPDASRARPMWEGNRVVRRGPVQLPACPGEVPPEAIARWRDHARGVGPGGGAWGGGGFVFVAVGPAPSPIPPIPPHHFAGLMLLSGLSSGNEEAAAYVLAGMAVAAIVAAPGVAVALASAKPEPGQEVAREIDEINRFNDSIRARVAECMNAAMARMEGG